MPWNYSQTTGELRQDARLVGKGYSGAPEAKNNPLMQQMRDVGPIPQGRYTIGAPKDSVGHGPHVMRLIPNGHDAFGRTDFLIHGERTKGPPGAASMGCIILDRPIRDQISASGDQDLVVTE